MRLTIMNCCCCCCCHCSSLEWCSKLCCPELNTHKASPYKYSPLIQGPEKKSSRNHGETPVGQEDRAVEAPYNFGRIKLRHTLMQGGSQFTVHPQVGLPISSTPITEQPSTSHRPFLRRFRESSDSLNSPSGSSVYREKTLRHQKCIDLPDQPDPTIQFSLHYDVLQSKLRIHLEYAADLPKENLLGMPVRCDPFVILHLEPDREDTLRSHVMKNTHDPIFNQDFQFIGFSIEDIKRQTLVLRICNHAMSNSFIGNIHLPLADVELFGVIMQMAIVRTEEKETNYQGDLLLSLSYSPVTRKLAGIISKATGLRKHDLLGSTDPYVKVLIMFNDKVIFKWKSSIRHHTLAPVYNERFNYVISQEMHAELDSITLAFYVVDFHHLSRNEPMGVVTVGRSAECKLARKHWAEVVQSNGQQISFWHPIQLATPAQKHHMRSKIPSPLPH